MTAELEQQTVETTPGDDAAIGAIWDRAQAEGIEDAKPVEAGPVRGPDGRFAKSSPEPATQSAEPAVEEGAAIEGEGSAAQPAIAAPAHLPQAVKAAWDSIPEAARQAIVEQQTAADRRFSELGRQIEQSRPVIERLTQATQQFPQFQGMTPDKLAQGALELAAIQAQLERGEPQARAQTIMQIAQRYGALPYLAAMVTGGQVDPTQAQLAQLASRPIPSMDQINETARQAAIQAAEESFARREIDAAVSEAAQKPFWAEVENALPSFVGIAKQQLPDASAKEILDAAYDMAIYANPVTRKKAMELEAKATTSTVDPKKAEAARRAASINVKPVSSGNSRVLSEAEAMGMAYDRAMAN